MAIPPADLAPGELAVPVCISVSNEPRVVRRRPVELGGIVNSLGALKVRCMLSHEKFESFVESGDVLEGLEIRLPGEDDRACVGFQDEYGLYLRCFDMGLRFPLGKWPTEVLASYDLAPGQLAPNAWAKIIGFHILFKRLFPDAEPSVSLFRSLFSIVNVPKVGTSLRVSGGWFSLSTRPLGKGEKKMFLEAPSSHNGWHGGFVFVKRTATCSARIRWRASRPSDSIPELSDLEEEYRAQLLSCEDPFDLQQLVEAKVIAESGIYEEYVPTQSFRVEYKAAGGMEAYWVREVNRNVLGYGGRQVARGETRSLVPLDRAEASGASLTLDESQSISRRLKHRRRATCDADGPSHGEGEAQLSLDCVASSFVFSVLFLMFDHFLV